MFDQLMKAEKAAVNKELSTTATVDTVEAFPDLDSLSLTGRRWKRLSPVVVVVADLKNSTKLGMGKNVNSTARIYRAATTRGVGVMASFDPDFSEVQGDGFFGVFFGADAYRRAMAAAMSLAHFSKYILEPGITRFLGKSCPPTGLKTGVTDGTVALSHLGVENASNYVWAGKPVNWAFKCSAAADRHEVVVTPNVYEKIVSRNDYVTMPCYVAGHNHGSNLKAQWTQEWVKAIGEWCWVRPDPWCESVGHDSCTALLAGQSDRNVGIWQRFSYRMS